MSGDHPVWYAFVRLFLRQVAFRATGGMRTVGSENVPRKGAYLLAPNHVSHIDPPLMAAAAPRRFRTVAKEELFRHKLFAALNRSLGAFPVKRGEGDTAAIRQMMSILEGGMPLLIFPEGTRGDGVSLQPLSRGVAMLAKRAGVPVVPVGIVGSNIVMPRGGGKGRRTRMTVAFGKPFTYAEVATAGTERENRELFLSELETRIRELCRAHGLDLKSATPDSDPGACPDPETPAAAPSLGAGESRSPS